MPRVLTLRSRFMVLEKAAVHVRVTAADFCFSGGYTQGYGASAKIKNFSKKIFNVVVVGVNYIPASTPYKIF